MQKWLILPFDDLSLFNNFQRFYIFYTIHTCLFCNDCLDYPSLVTVDMNVYLCYSLAITQSIKGK